MADAEVGPDRPDGEEEAIVLDAKGLRALAHPVRVQMVTLLRKHGPSTATRLAERLDVNSGTASYHLRQLAAAGFVAEDAERGNARERWWRSVHQLTRFDHEDLAEREPEAALAYLQSVHSAYTMRTQQGLHGLQTLPRPWREAFDMSDAALRLTPAEAREMRDEIWSVIERYKRASDDQKSQDTERVWVNLHVLPEVNLAAQEEN
ncbi:ArsR/SmtB family transcription factor [Streptomyces cyaneofuscatus]|uniref:ArsR/SmtB family transcription factor n=1 Tax=Streptomyces TaxID=1883 RepID=UPI0004C6B21A|nr:MULTISPECIES: helix-turn-helix domain-containing protein [Streptomyces]ONI51148.1 Helix-turn-helix domain protein [Streptomyces sp. IB2014 011-1]RDV48982.1 ArsR family transcriptional regulator [Streptomyces sp. IB2014 011-12]CAD5967746.1 Helix-turn-helix domain protein [Streptomyces sp. KY70]CAD5976187.1 Helix-turn-helix domain protein [Streptomyces sp. KY75]